MARPRIPAALLASLVLSACSSAPGRAERVGTRPDGGSVILSANNDKAWESANDLMRSHCGGPFRVVGQAQEPGQPQTRAPGVTPAGPAGPLGDPMSATSSTYGLRVDYECTGRPAGPDPGGVVPPGTSPANPPGGTGATPAGATPTGAPATSTPAPAR